MMKVGITGTRHKISDAARATLQRILGKMPSPFTELHHGDCTGADAAAHDIALAAGIDVVLHPPTIGLLRAYCKGATRTNNPVAYLKRNYNIVEHTNHLIAIPASATPALRSGTWATIRHATRVGRSVTLILPDGTTKIHPKLECISEETVRCMPECFAKPRAPPVKPHQ
jgi:hypothetical protein